MHRQAPAKQSRATQKAQKKVQKSKKVQKKVMTTTAHKVPTMDEIFTNPQCRTYRVWKADQVPASVVKKAYDQIKFGPTAFNCSPLRITILDNAQAKEKLVPHLLPGNVVPMQTAPVTAILSYDAQFNDHMDFLSPAYKGAGEYFKANPAAVLPAAQLNSNLQAGYLITALRAQCLDVAPANGFNTAGVDEAFFKPNEKTKNWKSFMYINVGHANHAEVFPRGPRFDFDTISSQI